MISRKKSSPSKWIPTLLAALCLFASGTLFAKVTFLEESTITNEGLYFYYSDGSKAYHYNPNISPRGDCVAVANGYIFFGWYKGGMTNRNLMISRKKIGSGNWVTVQLPHTNTLIQPGNLWGDSHRTISVAVSAIDGTVHIFYDHHNDPLNYIVSKKNKAFAPDSDFNLSAFEPTQGYLVPGEPITITYPKITQNDAGEIILNYRKGSAVGGNEMVHVYDGTAWTSNTQVTRGSGLPHVPVEERNYAYGRPYYNNGNVYYAWSVRWAAKQDQGILNEGVYLAKCGPTMTSPWEDPNGVQHPLPIQDYSPFLIDLPASNAGKGSSGGPGLVVSEDGDVHITYDGRGSGSTYHYTYTRKANENTFTKHTGVKKTGLAWDNRFYTINASGNGNITITSGEPGSVNYTTELVHRTSRSFGVSASYISDGKLVLIVSEDKQADKKDIYSYVFQLPADPEITGLSDTTIQEDAPIVIPFTVANMDTTSLSITATSSNTSLLPNAGIIPGGSGTNRTLAITPASGQAGQTVITVQADNGTETANADFTLTVVRPLFSTASDAEVQFTLTTPPYAIQGLTNPTLIAGTAGGTVGKERCPVFPFQLPDFGPVAKPFVSASFTVNHASNQNNPVGNVSVYGLGSRDTDTVLLDDYWTATPALDTTGAALLQTSLIPAGDTNFGLKTTGPSGSAYLTAWLNAQYAGGAGAGKYVFLRLSTDTAQVGGSSRYNLTSADGAAAAADTTIWPQINYLAAGDVTIPVVTLVDLGSPVNLTDGSSWSDGLPAHAGPAYVVPDTGNLRSETGTSAFPGFSLTVQGGGKFQFRGKEELGEVTTVDNLIATGGTPSTFVNLSAGTGNNTTNHLAGVLCNDGFTKLIGFGNSTGPRNLRISSLILGNGTLHSHGSTGYPHTCTIDHPGNSFSGVWESNIGTLVFENAGAIGAASIDVLTQGKLEIQDDWNQADIGATLTVADSSNALVELGSHDWTVMRLIIGGAEVAPGTYNAAQLNSVGSAVFSGSGTITVDAAIKAWRFDHFGTTANAGIAADTFDADGDGLTNWFEYLFGLDPTDGGSNIPITTLPSKSTGTFTYTRANPSLTGVTDYQVWTSENLVDWTHDTTALQTPDGTGEIQEVTVTLTPPLPASRLFVQVRVD